MQKSSTITFILIVLSLGVFLFNNFIADKKGVNSISYSIFSISGLNSKFLPRIKNAFNDSKKDMVLNNNQNRTVKDRDDIAISKSQEKLDIVENDSQESKTETLKNNEEKSLEFTVADNESSANITIQTNFKENIESVENSNLLSQNEIDETPVIDNEKDEIVAPYELLTSDEFAELLKKSILSDDILKLTSNSSLLVREENFKKMFLKPKEEIIELIPFIRSSDKVLVINVAELLSIFNCKAAVSELINRFNFEKDDIFKEKIIKLIGGIEDSKAYSFLNEVFIKTDSISLMIEIVDFIYEYPDPLVLKKAEQLIETSNDIHLKTILHKFYISSDKEKALNFAKTWLATHDARLDLICLSILMHSERTEDWEYIDKYKRAFFKSVDLMEAFFKAKSCMLTFQLKGSQKFDAMEEIFSSNKLLLAWLSLYSAKKHEHEGIEWVKKFSLKHNLFEYSDFIRSLYILDLPLPDLETVKENEAKNNVLKEVNTANVQNKKNTEKALAVCKIKFNSLPLGAKVYKGKNEIELKDDFISELSTGEHKIKIMVGNESSNTLIINVDKDSSKDIAVKKFKIPASIENSIGIKMKFIPIGEFNMGSAELNLKEHLVKFNKNIFVSIYEITNKQYETFKPNNVNIRDKRSDKDEQPVIMVNWYDAINFCNWLSDKEKLLPAYDDNCVFKETSNGYRLLTEAEWEYCARGGFTGKLYPWGNEEVKDKLYFANYYPRGGKELDGHIYTSPVGSYFENGFGLFDMAGNVSEWCNDWYDENYYNSFDSDKFAVNPIGPSTGSLRVTRGASWQTRDGIKCAYRSGAHPMDKANYRGFRIAKNVSNYYEYEISVVS